MNASYSSYCRKFLICTLENFVIIIIMMIYSSFQTSVITTVRARRIHYFHPNFLGQQQRQHEYPQSKLLYRKSAQQYQQQQQPYTTTAFVSSYNHRYIINNIISIEGNRCMYYGRIGGTCSSQQKQSRRYYHRSYIKMMPEGPEIRTVVDQLQDGGIGQRLIQFHFLPGCRYYNNNNNDMNNDSSSSSNDNVSILSTTKTKSLPDGYVQFQSTMTPLPIQKQSSSLSSVATPSDATATSTSTTSYSKNDVDIITDWNCKGKFMYILLDDNKNNNNNIKENQQQNDYQRSIWITFGMTGKFLSESVVQQCQLEERELHIRWYIELYNITSHQRTKIYYSDVRNFGTLKFCTSRIQLYEKLHLLLGPDLLQSCTMSDFLSILQKQRNKDMNICRFLMDQSKICGIGNYILAEGLYRANIDPYASISDLSIQQQQILYQRLYNVIHESYESQKTNSTYDYEFQCYGQKVCKRYGNEVIKDVNGPHGRTIWYTKEQVLKSRKDSNLQLQQSDKEAIVMTTETPAAAVTIPKRRNDLVNNIDVQEEDNIKIRMLSKQSNVAFNTPSRSDNDDLIEEQTISSTISKTRSTTIAKASTPGNLKLAAILAGGSNGKMISTISTKGLDGSAATKTAIDTTKLVSSLLNGITEPSWKKELTDVLQSSESFGKLAEFLKEEELAGKLVYPPVQDIFTAINLCPLDTVKVVIIGQDPYHRHGQSHGLAFSIKNKNVRAPPSLQNIMKELIDDIGIEDPMHGNLSCWAKRGVLLLNTVLTVREGEAFSHANQGWEDVTDTILRTICSRNTGGVVFLLWGNAAIKKIDNIVQHQKETDKYIIIQTSHPSPLGATKTKSPFLGSKCFSRTNKALIDMGHDPVEWSID